MKHSANYLAWAALLAFCVSCRTPDPLADGKPRIVSISFPGIPAKDVSIDQKRHVIRVKLPPLLPNSLRPKVKFVGEAYLKEVQWYKAFDMECLECRQLQLIDRWPSGNVLATYTLEFIPSGPLEIDAAALSSYTDRDLAVGMVLSVPFKNLHANRLPTQVKFTNLMTGETIVGDSASIDILATQGVALPLFQRGWNEPANRLIINFFNYMKEVVPGTYNVEFATADRKVLKVPQPFTIKNGPVIVMNWELKDVPRIRPGERFVFSGRNLFAENMDIEILGQDDRVVTLPEIEYGKYGTQAIMKIPASFAPGHYAVHFRDKVFRNTIYCYLLHVTAKEVMPFEISKILGFLNPCSLKGPQVITKDNNAPITFNGKAPTTRLKMVSAQDSTKIHFAKSELLKFGDEEGRPTINIPKDVPNDLYRVSMQVLDETGKVTQ
ncbi:hypothetical protein [Persicitalea sp.]|uniref:hypothetical protein n=1 Tax=Persicitalea sp. TaxID=3100273 RepID=UPI0035948236